MRTFFSNFPWKTQKCDGRIYDFVIVNVFNSFFTVMQQSATEKERGRSGQFNKRKYKLHLTVLYLMKLVKLQTFAF